MLSSIFDSSELKKLIATESWELARHQCRSKPREAKCWSSCPGFFDGIHNSKVLPIHMACALRAPRKMINALIRAYPEGLARRETSFRRLPIHIACRNGASSGTVSALLNGHPEGAQATDSMGRLPLHYACSEGASLEIVNDLLVAFPRACRAADCRGWLPIHVACTTGTPAAVIKALLEAYPESARLRTKKGTTPLGCTTNLATTNKDEIVALIKEGSRRAKKNSVYRATPKKHSSTCMFRRIMDSNQVGPALICESAVYA